MTEEELEKKAKEYATKDCNNYYGFEDYNSEYYKFGNCEHECLVRWETYKQAYKDGYEQGISEKQLIVKITTDKNNELYEENELLKSKIKNVYEVRQKAQSEIIIDFEKENEELKAQNEDIANINIKAQIIIAEQKQQIIKMKCCGNCKHYKYDYEDRYCIYDATRDKDCVNYSEWELAE